MSASCPFSTVNRLITGTNTTTGDAIVLLSSSVPMIPFPAPPNAPQEEPAFCSHIYRAGQLPVDNTDDTDYAKQDAERFVTQGPQFGLPGMWCTVIDVPPNGSSPMHRTLSYDIVIVFEGEIYLELDNNVEKVLKRGDIVIQRGTIHAWRNKSTEWTRMYTVLTNAEPIKLDDGKLLGSEFR